MTDTSLREDWAQALSLATAALKRHPAESRSLDEITQFLTVRPTTPTNWRFTHKGESGKTFYTFHDTTPENHYQTAYRDTCVEVLPLYSGLPDEWKDAVTDACTVAFIGWDDSDPRATLAKLISWEVEMALDPSISSAAVDLMKGILPNAGKPVSALVQTLMTGKTADPSDPPDVRGEMAVPVYGEEPFTETWHDFGERKPKSSGWYLVQCHNDGERMDGHELYPESDWRDLVYIEVDFDSYEDTGEVDYHIRNGNGCQEVSDIETYCMVPGEKYHYANFPVPQPGKVWRHTKGIEYTVLAIANLSGDTPHKFPPTVVYQGPNGKVWSRPVHDWYRSFTPVTPPEETLP